MNSFVPYFETKEEFESLDFKSFAQRKLDEMVKNGLTPPKWLVMEASYKPGVIENLEFKKL